ncbi:alpha/beta hydrolase family protein [Streptomyces sp. NPDC056069]|uniref:alpha/beta hydrolase family protein n=1 Tax=Streptomyces sp. NPDC056069 TaxID=3345702 RepID=UPI0035DD759F
MVNTSPPSLGNDASFSTGARNGGATVDAGQPDLSRGAFRFSPNGRHGVCLVLSRERWMIERWSIGEPLRSWPLSVPNAGYAQVGVDNAGAVTVLAPHGSQHEQLLVPALHEGPIQGPGQFVPARLCQLAQGVPGLAMSYTDLGTEVWKLNDLEPPSPLVTTHGTLKGGLPLEPSGRYIAFNRLLPGDLPEPVRIDTHTGALSPLAPDRQGVQILLTLPETCRMLLAVGLPERPMLATAELDPVLLTAQDIVLLPPQINDLDASIRPVAFDTQGSALYLAIDRGVRSRLIRHRLDDGVQEQVAMPLGVVAASGACHDGVLRFPVATPVRQLTLATVGGASPRRARLSGISSGESVSCLSVRTESFSTPTGLVEALVYGESWTTAHRVVVALHGGPEAHWQATFHPSLVHLAHAGLTVIAVNQRGSTGYGHQHQAAIHHAWGGPDLEDIHYIADSITNLRRPHHENRLMIYGASYGAFLALLTASTQPSHWSHCVAVAPFLSGNRLYPTATTPVRNLLDRLGGRTEITDRFGPRDLLRTAHALRARILLVHGTEDSVVPISQSRTLHQHLIGLQYSAELEFIEAPDAGHSPLLDQGGRPIHRRIAEFLSR